MRHLTIALILLIAFSSVALASSIDARVTVGASPYGIAIDSANGVAYVANDGDGTVTAIDTTTNAVVGTAYLGGAPAMVAVDAQRGHVFVSDSGAGDVWVLDATTLQLLTVLPVGALDLTIDEAHGLLYSTNSAALGVYDLATLAEVAVVPSNGRGNWWGVAVNPATHRIYVEDLDADNYAVTVMDAETYTVLARIPIAGEARFGIAVDTARDLVYVPNYAPSGSVSVIDGAMNAVISTTAVGSFPFDLLFDGQHLYTADLASGSVTVLSAGRAPSLIETVSTGGSPAGLALTNDGRLYVTDNASGSVVVVSFPAPNAPPVIDSVGVTPSAPHTNDTLNANVTAHDTDGDALTYAYQWTKNGSDIAGATNATLDLSVPGNGDRGDSIAVRVTANDGHTTSAPVTSSAVVVLDTAPVATVSISPVFPTMRDTVTATATATDADGDAVSFTYVWTLNGALVRTATTASTTDALDLSRGTAHVGEFLTVVVTPTDGTLAGTTSTASTFVRPGP